jgi:pyruvate dehydrogenase E2 component (dihydrolipoamide acetyltransferase)
MGEIFMPKMGDAMTEGKVVRWYKKQGDAVKKGEPMLEIETDKVNLDLEAEEDGFLGEIEVPDGEVAQVGATLALITAEAEAPSGKAKKKKKPEAEEADDAADEADDEAEEADDESDETADEPEEAADEADEEEEEEDEEESDAKPEEGVKAKGKPSKAKPDAPAVPAEEKKTSPDRKQKPVEKPETGKEEARAGRAAADGEPDGEERHEGRTRSSPLARRMARELGVEISALAGSGPGGRIVAADVDKAAKSGATPGAKGKPPSAERQAGGVRLERPAAIEGKKTPLSAMRRTIAKRLVESIGPVPHFFLTMDIDVTDLLNVRKQLIELSDSKISVNDFVVRAAALAILHHPLVNSSFTDEAIVQHDHVSIGIAVATPEGLITPVIRDADGKSVVEIADEVKLLAEKARNRKLKPDEYQGSTFTISNLGMYGIDEFTAIINPPNVAILAVGAAAAQPVVIDGQIVVRERMKVTMSCDHRVVDGAAGAEYLRTLKQYLEQPLRLIV